MQTYLTYILIFLIIIWMSHKAQKKNKKGYLVFAAIVLATIAGLRAETVGIDTANYIGLFDVIAQGDLELAYGLETSFKYICAFLLKISNHPNFLFLIFALITNILVFIRLWDFKDRISLPWATTVYFCNFYFLSFNIIRQFLAVSIVFYATRYLAEKKHLKFLIFVAVAALFHTTALLGVAFIVLGLFTWTYMTKAQKRVAAALLILGPLVLTMVDPASLERYLRYFSDFKFDFGVLLIFKILLFIVTSIPLSNEIARTHKSEENSPVIYSLAVCRVYYLIGILISMLGYIFLYMERIGTYFYLFETVYIGWLMKSKSVSVIPKIVILGLYVLLFILAVFGTGQGQGDYLFFWQSRSF